ncbi:biofilm operon icaADBC HTH-type negative transcriptional regulator IcaR [Clostridium homopropionicum DSM 5847]|uniref:Biofilm operon icaADBC HTH-type negative transcriptional regulator IcaR n=1 Tax=Clostridium homopropionicum DSM 5847 TaxID=1121318 RepID=A0A0L6Z6X1_9CLOT|nr:TetR family transcriptional regulator [Clostridium homopropionicum]KOA18706.1 biofilm operon icaADBC HTH-type negative transcriptional regulator IcaR [Clostridium homopropionicum DSM 5847]SFG53327.1 transcriptional regulator, TetR family [Clostridium homopropionicum]
MNTREKILIESLNLFSIKGYDSVSVRDISKAVGIKESSLYNHFKNKQDIFNTIINEYSRRGNEFFHGMRITDEDMQFVVDDRTITMYRNMTREQFLVIAGQIFEFYFLDEINVKLRKMLTIEQYRNAEINTLYRNLSFDDALNFQAKLFTGLMEIGSFIKTDPYMMAMAFFAPIFLIFYKYDNNEHSLAEAKELFNRHIFHFNEIYGTSSSCQDLK